MKPRVNAAHAASGAHPARALPAAHKMTSRRSAELAESIRSQGLMQPLLVRAGRPRPLRADRRRAALAGGADGGLEEVPALVREVPMKPRWRCR